MKKLRDFNFFIGNFLLSASSIGVKMPFPNKFCKYFWPKSFKVEFFENKKFKFNFLLHKNIHAVDLSFYDRFWPFVPSYSWPWPFPLSDRYRTVPYLFWPSGTFMIVKKSLPAAIFVSCCNIMTTCNIISVYP